MHNQSFPPQNLVEHTTLGAGRVWRNYLFPSLRFACEGRLETLEFTAELRTSDNSYWDRSLDLFMYVLRPSGQSQEYTLIAARRFGIALSDVNATLRITSAHSMRSSPLLVNFSIDVTENDIVGVALPPSTMQEYDGQQRLISEHIPILMRTSQICFSATECYQFVSTPLIKASFKPSQGRNSYST